MTTRNSTRSRHKTQTGPANPEEPPPQPPPTTNAGKLKTILEEARRPPKTMPTNQQKPGESHCNPTNRPQSPQTSTTPSEPVSTVTSPTSSMRTTIPSTQSDPDAKYTIRNIPTHYAAQKTFYNFLITTMGIRNITTLIVNNNKTALLIVPTALSDNFQKSLQTAINCTHITISPINRKNPTHQPNPKKPTFSVVIRNVPQDITPEDITTQCSSLTIVKAWRITSRKTNRPTTLIRILTTNKDTIDDMLINGVELFGRTFQCESSHPPTPTPIQCPRCFQFGHGQAECTNKPICAKCPDSHPPQQMPSKGALLPLLQGPSPGIVPIMPQTQRGRSDRNHPSSPRQNYRPTG
jgi:hypothetical protein